MVVSAAKLEANLRNARRSTGPRTEEGKERAKFNAVTHGMRAETLVLPDEDPQALEDRKAAWNASLSPRDDVEQRAVDDAVTYSWLQDRARRAQTDRLTANILNYGVEQAKATEKEVLDLGRRLFTDRMGPVVFYPTVDEHRNVFTTRHPSTSYAGKENEDPDRPGELVLDLQSTLLGCEWLLGEWAGLKAIVDEGQPWLSSDKLKAVRLLGKQPFDALDNRDVAMVFLAASVLKADKRPWYWEIETEMIEKDKMTFRNKAAARELESLKPGDAAKARETLLGIIARAIERLTAKAAAHRERARIEAALAPGILAFDDSPTGERLWRYELATGRGMARSLESLRKHRREAKLVSGPLSVVSGPSSVASCQVEASAAPDAPHEPTAAHGNTTNEPIEAEENATNEPTEVRGNATNEPVSSPLSVVRWPLPVVSCTVGSIDEPNATNEPTDDWGNVTNEPIYERGLVKRGGADFVRRGSRTSPSPSASVDLAHLRPACDDLGVHPATHPLSPRPRESIPPHCRHCTKR